MLNDKRLSDEQELLSETTDLDIISVVKVAARLSEAEAIIAAKDAQISLAETTMIEMHQDLNKLEADNAALTARVKRLDTPYNPMAEALATDKVKALETQLAAARKVLETLRSDCQTPIDMYERNGPEFTSPQGDEYESTSYVMDKFAELVASIDAALEVQP